jgi:multicomponent K+:H+ antiporter subunit E
MSRILPHPLLSLALLTMWVMLNSSVAPATLLGGVIVGLLVPFSMKALQPERPVVRAPDAILRLAGVVFVDVLRSNYAVATIILGRRKRERVSGFVQVPLDLKNRYALAVLAIIITSTPGTLWVQYNSSKGLLLLHVLDLVDESEWIHLIKNRYERLLLEIFP